MAFMIIWQLNNKSFCALTCTKEFSNQLLHSHPILSHHTTPTPIPSHWLHIPPLIPHLHTCYHHNRSHPFATTPTPLHPHLLLRTCFHSFDSCTTAPTPPYTLPHLILPPHTCSQHLPLPPLRTHYHA